MFLCFPQMGKRPITKVTVPRCEFVHLSYVLLVMYESGRAAKQRVLRLDFPTTLRCYGEDSKRGREEQVPARTAGSGSPGSTSLGHGPEWQIV